MEINSTLNYLNLPANVPTKQSTTGMLSLESKILVILFFTGNLTNRVIIRESIVLASVLALRQMCLSVVFDRWKKAEIM